MARLKKPSADQDGKVGALIAGLPAPKAEVSGRGYRRLMPEICRFYGIVITINYSDHAPPHFHARYGGEQASVTLDGQILSGHLPPRALVMVVDWALLRRRELEDDWARARDQQPLVPIAPID